MKVVTATQSANGGLPFQNHDVREWSRVDRLTGALERARLETDHWTANTDNSSHKYGKVVDSRSLCAADGALQQQAKRQLEVFQSQIPGGRLQVIKTHTISSSRWTNNTTPSISNSEDIDRNFENLQLAVNSLDLTSQKSKANAVKSVTRRPPSRSRAFEKKETEPQITTNIPRVARLCRQVHEDNIRQITGITNSYNKDSNKEKSVDECQYPKLTRTKSSSSEDLNTASNEKDDFENSHLKRASKIRLSLQLSKQNKTPVKPVELPNNIGNVHKICKDFETGRRLSAALRGNTVNLNSLDQLWQSVSNHQSKESDEENSAPVKQKRDSFVTVESLKEVRGKLRRTSLSQNEKVEDIDDGIVAENSLSTEFDNDNDTKTNSKSHIRSYIYGMENMQNSKSASGTGSLDSKSKLTFLNRSEDWYNRRKSYGFEQVSNEHEQSNSMLLKNNQFDSSTDSGICKSTDVIIPESDYSNNVPKTGSVKKFSYFFEQNGRNEGDIKDSKDIKTTTIKIPLVSENTWQHFIDDRSKRHSIAVDESKYMTKNGDLFNRNNLNDKISNVTIVNNENESDILHTRKPNKKVEFCKTEIHFAAESGKVNIVETDEKPPPTNNFRRRRKNLGFNSEDLGKNDLPVLHFGDSTYEKSLLGLNDLEYVSNDKNFYSENQSNLYNNVTVNTQLNNLETDDDDRRGSWENEIPRGILKNKPVKPKPYHLGDSENLLQEMNSESNIWDIKLRSVDKNKNSCWKSTVSISDIQKSDDNFDLERAKETEFQKLLKTLKPINKSSQLENNQLNSVYMVNKVSHLETQKIQNGSKLSVAERIKQVEELQSSSNKGFSTKINFGNGEATVVENSSPGYEKAKHLTWPRSENFIKDEIIHSGLESSIQDSSKTTTKINIDLTPSFNGAKKSHLSNSKLPRTPVHTFKSPKLILNTIKNDTNVSIQNENSVLQTIDVMDSIPKQLEALKMLYEDAQSENENDKDWWCHNSTPNKLEEAINDSGSVASGSWSRMKTFKNISQQINKTTKIQNQIGRNANYNVQSEKDSTQNKNKTFTRYLESSLISDKNDELTEPDFDENISSVPLLTKLKIGFPSGKLSSPELVGHNFKSHELIFKNKQNRQTNLLQTEFDSKKTEIYSSKLPKKEAVLRQPAKSEMAYFGINVSPEPNLSTKKTLKKEKVQQKISTNNTTFTRTDVNAKKLKETSKFPIYENVKDIKYSKQNNDFDDSILLELTKAADEILQSVKEFTDAEEKTVETKPLDTIPEKKSWKQERYNDKLKVKHKSSTSSTNSTQRKSTSSKQTLEKSKKKVDESSSKTTTKVRRLQRASSREALLQSHGSSSEDLGANKEPPVRKPRQIKRTKTTVTASNGVETCKTNETKKIDAYKGKSNERVPSTKLPEIRHKTAVSTIRSVSGRSKDEKAVKEKCDRLKRKIPQKKVAGTKALVKTENDNEVAVKPTGSHHNTPAYVPVYRTRSRYEKHNECPCLCS